MDEALLVTTFAGFPGMRTVDPQVSPTIMLPQPAERFKVSVLCEVGLQNMAVLFDHEVVSKQLTQRLKKAFHFSGQVQFFSTSRRLAWLITSLELFQVTYPQQLEQLTQVFQQLLDHCFRFDFHLFAHWLCLVSDQAVIPFTKWGLTSSNLTYDLQGQPLVLTHALAYEDLLEAHQMVPCYAKREQLVRDALAPSYLEHCTPIMQPTTVAIMTQTVENVQVVSCQFDAKFLAWQELSLYFTELILAKKACCAFFRHKADGSLSNHFLVLVNTLQTPAADVAFYWNKTINNYLTSIYYFYTLDGTLVNLAALKQLVISPLLGTVYDQIMRFRECVTAWAPQLPALSVTTMLAACDFMRADSVKQLVHKYPQLAFLMSAHYAQLHGASPAVVNIIKALSPHSQYAILTQEAALLSLLYHLDFILSTHLTFHNIQDFALGSDPFEIRRYTHKVLQLLHQLDVSLMTGISLLLQSYGTQYTHYLHFFGAFFLSRLVTYCQQHQLLLALPKTSLNLYQIQQRHDYFHAHPLLWHHILQMQKRITKILAQQAVVELTLTVSLLDNFELLLYDQSLALDQQAFGAIVAHLPAFLQDLERLFKHYLINDVNPLIKGNRIMLIAQVNRCLTYLITDAPIKP